MELETSSVKYRECLKNHAANTGGKVLDGCGEFMPCNATDDQDQASMKCAACGCHRNFHRKDITGGDAHFKSKSNHRHHVMFVNNNHLRIPVLPPPPPLPLLHQKFSVSLNLHSNPISNTTTSANYCNSSIVDVAPMRVAFGGNSTSTDHHLKAGAAVALSTKKRFRTKFTVEQKEKMLEFAEKVGWKIQKQDEKEVEGFCAQAGVKKQVLRVWMHNNKNAAVVKKGFDNQITSLGHFSISGD